MKIPYAAPYYGASEMHAVRQVLQDAKQLVAGPAVAAFEEKVSGLFGKKHGVMVNSGSSANLLALDALDLDVGSEVVTPALTFATTVAPILQLDLEPVFVDVIKDTFVVDIEQLSMATTSKTRAWMIPALLGNLPDMEQLAHLAAQYGVWLILDACDTLGGSFGADLLGKYADIVTTSFYATHIITAAGGGGMVCCDDKWMSDKHRLLANWGRASTLFGPGEQSEDMDERYSGTIDGDIQYDAKFTFTAQGYNMQPLELQAAFGLEQLERLPWLLQRREFNWLALDTFFQSLTDIYFDAPVVWAGAYPHWLAYPIQVKASAPFTRVQLAKYLESHGIQTRPIMTGNILRQPGFHGMFATQELLNFPESDNVMRHGLLLGCHPGISTSDINYIKMTVLHFIELVEER